MCVLEVVDGDKVEGGGEEEGHMEEGVTVSRHLGSNGLKQGQHRSQ